MPPKGRRRRTVLVVDDDRFNREGLALVLRGEEYSVRTAANGAQALGVLAEGPIPDVLLLDMMLPRVDGWDVLRAMQADTRLASIQVILMAEGDTTAAWALSLGASGWVRKPIELAELLEVLAFLELQRRHG